MKKFAAIAAAIATVALAPAASAATYFSYTSNVGGSFGNDDLPTYVKGDRSTLFRDTFDFTTDFARNATIDITSSYPSGDLSYNVNFISNGVTFNSVLVPAVSTGQFEKRYLLNFRIPAGVQKIFVSGAAQANGTYQGVLTLSGVPEPAAWTLMILGFGAIGGAMRRRKSAVAFA